MPDHHLSYPQDPHGSDEEIADELFEAIRSGDINKVRVILDISPSLVGAHARFEQRQGRNTPALLLAIFPANRGFEELGQRWPLVKRLLEHAVGPGNLTGKEQAMLE